MDARLRSRSRLFSAWILATLMAAASAQAQESGVDHDRGARERGRLPRGDRSRPTLFLPGGDGNLPILPPGGPRAASGLDATPSCDPDVVNKGQAVLEWRPASESGSEQLVQVTIFREGFETGNYLLSRPLPPRQTSLAFTQVAGQALHRWRVLTRHEDGYVPSETVTFTGPICVFDEGREEGNDDIPR